MFQAIIADDEQRIVQLIRELINWEALDIEVVAEANNGIDALLLVKEMNPDILITDIRFPGIDGLELTKRVHDMNPTISTIIISGYKQFDYAHTALKYGVVDYLVKPINKIDLENSLRKICLQKKVDFSTSKEHIELKEQSILSSVMLREQFLVDCMSQTMPYESIESINNAYMYKFSEGRCLAFLVYINVNDSNVIEHQIIEKTKKCCENIFLDTLDEYQAIETDIGLLVIGNYGIDKSDDIKNRLSKILRALNSELEFYGDIQIAIALDNTMTDPLGFQQSIVTLNTGLSVKCVNGSSNLIEIKDYDFSTTEAILSESEKMTIMKIVGNFGYDELEHWIKKKYKDINKKIMVKPWLAFSGAVEITSIFGTILLNSHVNEDYLNMVKQQLIRAENLNELIEALSELLKNKLSEQYDERKMRISQPIRQAKEFMKEHVGEQITIEDVAADVNLSYSYFSSLFKNETGNTVSQYLLDIRLDKAKKYIRETTMNLSEITEHLGYTDSRHFSKLFKKNLGVSFNEYKRLYR